MVAITLTTSGCDDTRQREPRADTAPPAVSSAGCGEIPDAPREGAVSVYFNCGSAPPGSLAPVHRAVADSAAALRVAIEALLAGPTPAERSRGFSSHFSERSAGALIGARRTPRGDTAWLDFESFATALPDAPGVKSFLPPGVMAGLTWTVFRSFPEIDAIRFAFDGSEAAFWRWLGSEPEVFTREDWERI